ncbi:MAG: hypothetical protein ACI9QC_000573 [Oceanicoccus sp.]|jgi:hypothetical protein
MILDHIAFRNLLNKGEDIQYVGHTHPFVIYPKLFKIMFLGMVMPGVAYALFPLAPFSLLWGAWAGMGILLFAYRVLQWYLDVWIVTNLGVIDHEWNSFIDQATTRIEYGNIEGISHEIKGFWGTVLRFGDLQVEHMSGEPISIEKVASPRKIERHIIANQTNFMRKQNFEDHGKLKDLLVNLLRTAPKK